MVAAAASLRPVPVFTDARSCKDWLNGLPLANMPKAQQLILEALRSPSRGGSGALEWLKCLELVREKIAFLLGEQRSRYFGKALPLSANDEAAWMLARSLLEEMEAAYRLCLAPVQAGAGEVARLEPLVMQRIIRYLGAQMLLHAMAYRRFEPALWQRLHEQFAIAERKGVADERVKDSLESADGTSSVHEAYAGVVLMQAARLSGMTAPQAGLLETLLRMWARKVRVAAQEPVDSRPATIFPLVVDLAEQEGASCLAAGHLRPTHRVLDVEALSKSIRRRLKGLQAGEEPASLGLPAGVLAVDALAQLGRLHRLWCEVAPAHPPGKVPEEAVAAIAFGLPEIHYFFTGAAFEQPDKSRELTRREKDDLAVFGKVTERTQQLRLADYRFALENWGVVDEMRGVWRLARPPDATKGVAVGRVLAMRPGAAAPFQLGMVQALEQAADGSIVMTVAQFPGVPEPIAVRAADLRNRQGAQWSQAFRLPQVEPLHVPESLVIPVGIAARGRGVEVWAGGAKETTVYEFLERGSDFDRVTVF